MKKLVVLALTGLLIMGAVGCASDNKEEPVAVEYESTEAATEATTEEAVTEATAEATTEGKVPSKEGNELFQKFLSDELEADGAKFSELYADAIDFDGMPLAYYIDLDEDGEDELIVNSVYCGWDVYGIIDGQIKKIDGGCGTADVARIVKGNGHYYIGHTDFSHSGRRFMELVRYDNEGNLLESIYIISIYEGQSDYDENSKFYYYEGDIEHAYDDANLITMEEYDHYMDCYDFPDSSIEESGEFVSAWEE